MVKLVQEYFSESAKKYPNKIAVDFGDTGVTFSELDKSSNQLARVLKKRGVKKGDRVCFCLPKSIDSIKSVLAILKADAVYVPLDAKAPRTRLEQVVSDAQPAVIIYNNQTSKLVSGFSDLFNLDMEQSAVTAISDDYLAYENDSTDLAYILYTSGSTGQSKGVMITHGNIVNATDWAVEELGITSEDRMSQHPPLHFDLSTFDLYCAFRSGATLYLVPEELSLFPGQLTKFIEEKKLTIWNSVPSVMVYLWNSGLVKPDRLPKLKKIFFNGEGFPTKYLAEWMKIFPDKEFVNMYGPTETTVQCSFYRIPEAPKDLTKLVPIGKACRGVEVFDVEGELYVAGKGVSPGYWENQEKTDKVFIPDPRPGKTGKVYKTGDLVKLRKDGNYEFIGRKDNQVKIHGNRIELGDIDSALYSLPYVNEAATIAVPEGETGGSFLVAFIDLKLPKPEADIKKDLSRILPPYMIPKKIVERKLPKTSTGKIDRVKLKNEYIGRKT
ncbi:MAG: amino acid adenylation domain-containing protein [Parcubacteria group bacterium]|nr:amino acid adenylation domain-containing protein [Parcubacteria group bacterium]